MGETQVSSKPQIAVFAGPTATIQNTEPLVTSNKAREKYGLPLRKNPDGSPMLYDIVRAQRLAAPVTVYIEQFSAHPLEHDAAELYGPPDGYVDPSGTFHKQRQGPKDVAVYEVALRPEDGLYFLPYMARQANGQAWEDDGAEPSAPEERCRQPFFPDGSRLFEEIDRFGIGHSGVPDLLSSKATFDFYRPAPSGGYKKGLAGSERKDVGQGDIPPETLGKDFFAYRPHHIKRQPSLPVLARVTNVVQRAMASGRYAGAIWLEGSPNVEETGYWLNLLIDTTVPIVGNASQRPHGSLGNDGDRNITASVEYIVSRVWADASGRDYIGAVMIQEEQIFTVREVQKSDARPGGYVATGGHGGIVGRLRDSGPPVLTFKPTRRHTHASAVKLALLPVTVEGTTLVGGKAARVSVRIKDARGELLEAAIPKVSFVKHARYQMDNESADPMQEVDILARIEKNLRDAPLAGFVAEGAAPYGAVNESIDLALKRATFRGMPVVKVGRGNTAGFADEDPGHLWIAGNNLTASKARLLLMACLMKFGSLPPAADPDNPTPSELEAIKAKLRDYQAIFDSH